MLKARTERTLTLNLRSPHRLIPVHIGGRPPPYFILGGLVFTQVPLRLRMLCHASACACHGLVGLSLSLSWACQCLSWWGSIDSPASTVPAQPVQIRRCCAVTSGLCGTGVSSNLSPAVNITIKITSERASSICMLYLGIAQST